MFSQEDRKKAVELYIKYDKGAADVMRELGYPVYKTLMKWYNEYLEEQETGVKKERSKMFKFTSDQKKKAVKYYLEHGKNFSRTIRILGYPSRTLLRYWVDEIAPEHRKKRILSVQYSYEQKKESVVALCTRKSSAKEVASELGVSREVLYSWKKKLLGKEEFYTVKRKNTPPLSEEAAELLSEITELKRHVRKLNLEKDILEGTIEILKKDPGVDPKNLTNKEKSILVAALKSEYKVYELLESLGIRRSTFFYIQNTMKQPFKYEETQGRIKSLFKENDSRYGYRRLHAELRKEEIFVSEKVVRRLMNQSNLIVKSKKRKKYSSYQGEGLPGAVNIINRDFHAEKPNEKWLTDITEFHIPAGTIYLSPIVDCFDGCLPSWTIGTSPNAKLANDMLSGAISTLEDGQRPIVHSDRGAHYRWPGWIKLMKEASLTQSMSKKGCSPDNAACEGLFGRIKNEMFYNRPWSGISVDEFMTILNDYLIWYNTKRIKKSLGYLSPIEYRKSIGLSV